MPTKCENKMRRKKNWKLYLEKQVSAGEGTECETLRQGYRAATAEKKLVEKFSRVFEFIFKDHINYGALLLLSKKQWTCQK